MCSDVYDSYVEAGQGFAEQYSDTGLSPAHSVEVLHVRLSSRLPHEQLCPYDDLDDLDDLICDGRNRRIFAGGALQFDRDQGYLLLMQRAFDGSLSDHGVLAKDVWDNLMKAEIDSPEEFAKTLAVPGYLQTGVLRFRQFARGKVRITNDSALEKFSYGFEIGQG